VLLPLNEIKEIDQIADFEDRIHEAAKLYARAGIPVVPLRPNSKILPKKESGINYHSCSTKEGTMDRWFDAEGKYRGYNIGIVCGEVMFAIDLDLHNPEKNGIEAWTHLSENREMDNVPVQETPTGGQHMLFKWRENLTSSSGKLGPGVDTRGGDGSPRSHIVAWPSYVEWEEPDGEDDTIQKSGTYSWAEGGDVPDAPEWIAELMGVPWVHAPGRGNEEVGEGDGEKTYKLSQIAAMLDHIDPNILSYEEWLFIGQAINSQHPGNDGRDLWDNWSENGERYVAGECNKRWPGFNPSGTIRIGSLIYFAKQGGYSADSDPARTGDFDELIERMNEDNSILLTGGKIRILHRDKLGGIHIMGTGDFNTLMYNRKVTIPRARRKFTEADIWMASPERRECVRGMGFFPDQPLWHDGYVNLWQGWGCEPKEGGSWAMFDQHILNVLCNGDKKLYDYVLDWVADILQDPMKPKGTAIVMHGEEGTGKGTFCHIVGHLVGQKHYKHITNEKHLTGNFNYLLMDGLLIFADEVVYGGSRSTAGILKSMVTEKELVCEKKGVDPFMYENRGRIVIASNEDWFIPAGPESRRWLVLEVNDSVKSDPRYFNALYDQMEDGGYEAMMYDLLNREIKSNLTRAIETAGLKAQRAIYRATGDSVDQWMDYCIGVQNLGCIDEGEGDWPDSVDRVGLFKTYQKWMKEHGGLRTKGNAHFYKKVEGYGFIRSRPASKEGAIRRWRYKIPHYDEFTIQS